MVQSGLAQKGRTRRHGPRSVPSGPDEAARAAGLPGWGLPPPRRRRDRGKIRGKIKNNYSPPYRYATRRAVAL